MKKILLLFAALCAGISALAQGLPRGEWAVINASTVFMRDTPSYSSENVSQSRMGTLVQVLERQSYWVKIHTPEPYEGWVNELTLAPCKEPALYRAAPKYIFTAEYGHIYSAPSEKSLRVSDFVMSDMILKGHGKPRRGWVSVTLPSGKSGWVRKSEVKDFTAYMQGVKDNPGQDIVELAKLFVGVPYMWGGMSPKHFDCSGLAGFCYFMNGILLPRDASKQALCGVEIPYEQALPGDLIFFGKKKVTHVAIYMGGDRIVHSSQLVRINSLDPSAPDYYEGNRLHVRRIIGNLTPETNARAIGSERVYFAQ